MGHGASVAGRDKSRSMSRPSRKSLQRIVAPTLLVTLVLAGLQAPLGQAEALDEYADAPAGFYANNVFEGLKNKAARLMTPGNTDSPYVYAFLGFGDSYGSGEGAPDGPERDYSDYEEDQFLPRSEHLENFTGGTIANWTDNTCHISTNSAAYQHIANLRKIFGENIVGANFACTGAESYHVVGSNFLNCAERGFNRGSDQGYRLFRPEAWGLCGPRAVDAYAQYVASIPGPTGAVQSEALTPANGWGGSRSYASGPYRNVSRTESYLPSIRPPYLARENDYDEDAFDVFRNYITDHDWADACSDVAGAIPADWRYEDIGHLNEEGFIAAVADQIPGLAIKCNSSDANSQQFYQSQLWYANKWLENLSAEVSPKEVVVLGGYISAGGNDKAFGPVVASAIGGDDGDSGGLEDSVLSQSVRDYPSITWQLQSTYTILNEFMRTWNAKRTYTSPTGQKTSVDSIIQPFITVQGYPADALTDGRGRPCDEIEPDNDSASVNALVEDLDRYESQFIQANLIGPLNRDVNDAALRSRAMGVDVDVVTWVTGWHGVCAATTPTDSNFMNDGVRWFNNDIDAEDRQGRDMFATWVSGYGALLTSKGAFHPNVYGFRAAFESGRSDVEDKVRTRLAALAQTDTLVDRCVDASTVEDSQGHRLSNAGVLRALENGNLFNTQVQVGQHLLGASWQLSSTEDQFGAGQPEYFVNANNALLHFRASSPQVPKLPTAGPSIRGVYDLEATVRRIGGRDHRFPRFQTSGLWDPLDRAQRREFTAAQLSERIPLAANVTRAVRLVASGSTRAFQDGRGKPVESGVSTPFAVTVLDGCTYPDGALVVIRDPISGLTLSSRPSLIGGVEWEAVGDLSAIATQSDGEAKKRWATLPQAASGKLTTDHVWMLSFGSAKGPTDDLYRDEGVVTQFPTLLPLPRAGRASLRQNQGPVNQSPLTLNSARKSLFTADANLRVGDAVPGRHNPSCVMPDFERLTLGPYTQQVAFDGYSLKPVYASFYGRRVAPMKQANVSQATLGYSCVSGSQTAYSSSVSFQCSSTDAENYAQGRASDGRFGGTTVRFLGLNLCDREALFPR